MTMPLASAQDLLSLLCGGFVGFALALIGGGGSILAVPLLLYVVGVSSPHLAIGTSALSVAVNAFANLIPHSRAGHVRWQAAAVFATAGVIGAFFGSSIGKLVDGQRLLLLFALLMLVVAFLMVRPRRPAAGPVCEGRACIIRLGVIGLAAGSLAGFFGIGGGFLIVPGLILATGMSIINAIGTSLFSVGAFGLTTALNYSVSGLVDWRIALLFIGGGIGGGWLGAALAQRLARYRNALNYVFASAIVAVAILMLIQTGMAPFGQSLAQSNETAAAPVK
jgi:uncharacterized membrane protein YfcA